MPYIKQARREQLGDVDGTVIDTAVAENAGELNYIFTAAIDRYIAKNGLSYQRINDIVGALEGAKLEFYTRFVSQYESIKISENGDCYPATNRAAYEAERSHQLKSGSPAW